jgi:hypothetical protein
LIEVISSTIYAIALNRIVRRRYPWLNSTPRKGKLLRIKYSIVLTKARQVFSHQFGYFVLTQTDQIIIYSLLSLWHVTVFANYVLIFQKISGLLGQLLSSNSAGVGNLIASNNEAKIYSTFQELLVLRILFAGTAIFSLYYFTPTFVLLWLGPVFQLDNTTFVFMLCTTYITLVRPVVDSYINGFGLFGDVWAPWIELLLNLTISIFFGIHFGILGVVLGSLISLFVVVVIWKPYYLFKMGLKLSLFCYWKNYLHYSGVVLIVSTMFYYFLNWFNFDEFNTWIDLIFTATLTILSYFITLSIFLYLSSKHMRSLCKRLQKHFIFN